MKTSVYYIIFFFLSAYTSFSQLNLDSLDNTLKGKSVDEKVIVYEDLAFTLMRPQTNTAIALLNKALAFENQIKIDTNKINLFLTLSIAYRYTDNMKLAFDYAYKALSIASNSKNKNKKKFLIRVHNQIANSFTSINDYRSSIKHQYRVISYAKELKDQNDTVRLFYAYCNLSNTFLLLDLPDDALNVCNDAQKMVGKNIGELDYHIILLNKGVALFLKGKNNEALDNFFKALEHYNYIYEKFKNTNRITTGITIQGNINIAEVYYKLNQLEKSLAHILKAKALLLPNSVSYDKISIYTAHAKIIFKMGKKQEAFKYINIAKELAENLKNFYLLKELYKTLLSFYESNKDYDKALEYSKKYSQLLDTLRIQSNAQLHTNLSLMLDLDEMSTKQTLLKHEKIEQEQEKKRIEQTRFYIIIVAIVFFALSIFMIYLLLKNKKINTQLKAAEEKQKAINQTKDKFFSIIAHDLRNPLGAYKMLTELITGQAEILSKEKIVNFVKKMDTSLINTISFVENLLTWARTQSDVIEFTPSNYDINKIIAESVQLLKVNADAKLITIFTDTHEPIEVYQDIYMISGVIRNLLSNAIKFTPEGGYIELGVENDTKSEYINFYIKDSGIGMPPEQVEKLFRIDVNVSTLGTSSEKGTGLGLILCKEFVEKHNGKIWVESKENEGSCFQFSILKNKS